PALDRSDRTSANFRRFLVGEAAGTNENQRFTLGLRQMHQRTLHVAKLDMPILARGCSKDLGRGDIVPLTLEAGTAHLAEKQVAKDDESPGAHVGAGLEALARRPRFQQRFLHQIIGEVAAARKRATEGAQVWNDRRKLFLELRIGQRNRFGRMAYWSVLLAIFSQTRPHPVRARDLGHTQLDRT